MPQNHSKIREFEERMSQLSTTQQLAAYAAIQAQKDYDNLCHEREERRLGHYDDDYLKAEQDAIDSCN